MRINTSLASLALLCVCSLSGAASPLMGSVVQPGEELQYKVKYGFVRLGTVVVKTEQDPYSHDPNMVRVTFTMDTDPKIPFLNVHEYSESTMNRWRLTSERFYGEHAKKGHKIRVRFQYDEPHKLVWWDRTDLATGATLNHDTIHNMQPFLEGPSLFTYGRAMSGSHDVVTMPILVDGAVGSAKLDYTKGRAYVDVDAFDEHVRTRKYQGETNTAVSTAAMTGPFTVWVSDDDAAVPVRLEMKIVVGSITMELEKWNRPGWQPPLQ